MAAFKYYTPKEQKEEKEKAKNAKLEDYKKQCIDRCNTLSAEKGWTGEYLYKKSTPKSQKALSKKGGRRKSRKHRKTRKWFGLF
jgi:hypothetical protein